ncbi:signal transducer and activator of transcription C-like [Ochlerotatus camptorhynchus]|uniref:signal transducer and activator of transcription C-like n=1 Tax=Ochlerotatus camptorhynchus TaxID=644619 RepID=UPI0031E094AC
MDHHQQQKQQQQKQQQQKQQQQIQQHDKGQDSMKLFRSGLAGAQDDDDLCHEWHKFSSEVNGESLTNSLDTALAYDKPGAVEGPSQVSKPNSIRSRRTVCGFFSSNQPPPVKQMNVRLPELDLPKFSGRLEDWCVFRDSFESAVGSRSDNGAVEKMHYLKGLVQGEAASTLDPIKVSEQGYKDAWRTLKLRFENKRHLIKCHLKTLFDTPAMREESSE